MPDSAVIHDKAELYDDTSAERNRLFAARVGPFLAHRVSTRSEPFRTNAAVAEIGPSRA
jgi:hypothetical protein